MTSPRTIPLTCRLNLWHVWKPFSSDDGTRFLKCARCGKDKPDRGSGANTIGA